MELAILIPVIIALIAAIGGYITTLRKLSGKISSSSAEDLWAESREMRRDLGEQVTQMNETINKMQFRIDELEKARDILLTENIQLKKTSSQLSIELEQLRASRGV